MEAQDTSIATVGPMVGELLEDSRRRDGQIPVEAVPEPEGEPRARRFGSAKPKPKQISWWLFIVAGLVYALVFIGGATRLTQSGLSITKWEPVRGVVPPLSDSDWAVEFDSYRASPEYQLVNRGMDLSQFKEIFWWEYLHRLVARLVGLALAVPFLWFLLRREIPPGYGRRIALLVALVGLQGAIGWWMVASGLVDRPDVAHERLALHLVTALLLLAAVMWTALDLRSLAAGREKIEGRPSWWVVPFLVVLVAQIVLGAFVAGLDAGRMYNTWPMVGGSWIPDGVGSFSPVWANAVDNPIAVQFLHRWMAVVVAVAALGVAALLFRSGAKAIATTLEVVVLAQFVLGVLTLLNAVPVGLGIAHQAGGVALLVVTVFAAHWATGGARRPRPSHKGGSHS